ncbi:MAG: peptidylprolyl isomerase [Verrucomicrobia bacterium]|nr:peptidylprolyl isomerase [Cytophagales bacterium]
MTIQDNKVVSLTYELEVDDLETGNRMVADKSEEDHPLVFLFGQGQLLPLFEQNIKGMKIGDTFAFSVPAVEGYGDYDDSAMVEMAIETFQVDGEIDNEMLQIGNVLPMMDNEGNRLDGRIVEMDEKSVTMDFNHPLAGYDLHFKGTVTGLRDASAEELAHGHVHGDGGVEH